MDSTHRTSLTEPNDLLDGDVQVVPTTVEQRITVGGVDAQIPGRTSAAIQIAVDALALRGGGTVELKPGSYSISVPIRLASNTSLVGAGDSTILCKVDGYRSLLSIDADYGMFKVTVQDARGFSPGMGVQISDTRYASDHDVTVAAILKIEGDTVFLDRHTLRDYDCAHKAVLSNTCSIVEAIEVDNVRIAGFAVDGNRKTNDTLSGCRGGAIYLHKAKGCLVENVRAGNFNGDVFAWQITTDITLRECEAFQSTGKGFHPGTGSENSLIERCSSHHNCDGIFLCWRVKKSTLRDNSVYSNDRDGVSLNKKDTDNTFAGNHIYGNGRNGVWFNDYGEANNSHRNLFEENLIEDNGMKENGCGISIDSAIRDITIRNNTIRDTGSATQRCAVLIGKSAANIELFDNTMSGHCERDVVRK